MLRQITDEVMFEIRNLSGQEYVDTYATKGSAGKAAAVPELPGVIEETRPRDGGASGCRGHPVPRPAIRRLRSQASGGDGGARGRVRPIRRASHAGAGGITGPRGIPERCRRRRASFVGRSAAAASARWCVTEPLRSQGMLSWRHIVAR
ncbi:MAG: hypothetical protein M5U19_09970 [Microthrixaceae bacterium]|nr:hypothetical protein [Microthrixaceae bacterium]